MLLKTQQCACPCAQLGKQSQLHCNLAAMWLCLARGLHWPAVSSMGQRLKGARKALGPQLSCRSRKVRKRRAEATARLHVFNGASSPQAGPRAESSDVKPRSSTTKAAKVGRAAGSYTRAEVSTVER